MKKSSRKRAKSRTIVTYNNKIRTLKSIYNKRFNTSKRYKDIFNKLNEEEQKIKILRKSQTNEKDIKKEPKAFFCDKYPKFESFLKAMNIKEVGREETKTITTIKRKLNMGIWER